MFIYLLEGISHIILTRSTGHGNPCLTCSPVCSSYFQLAKLGTCNDLLGRSTNLLVLEHDANFSHRIEAAGTEINLARRKKGFLVAARAESKNH